PAPHLSPLSLHDALPISNLAVLFSQLGERTLLIDADLRAPRQHRIFDVPDTFGLSAVLSGRADRNAVMPIPNFGRLSVLPAGARDRKSTRLNSSHRTISY